MAKSSLDLSRCNVFFDFDNTITPFDVLDEIVERFSVNDDWLELESAWRKGKIGSKECLKGQMRSLRATKGRMTDYLCTVKADKGFKPLLAFLKKNGVKPVILSDSFSFFIRNILHNNGFKGIRIYSNEISFKKDRLVPEFPRTNGSCGSCAHCKKLSLVSCDGAEGRTNIYIGDGLSDVCPAEHCDMVFAKGTLLRHLKEKKKKCIPFNDLGDVYRRLKEESGC